MIGPTLKTLIRSIPGAGFVVWPVGNQAAAVVVSADDCEGDPGLAAAAVADTLPGNRPVYVADSWGYVRLSTAGNEAVRNATTRELEAPLVSESRANWRAQQ